MNAQQLANAIVALLPQVKVPLTVENAQGALQVYDTLGKMARGELILTIPGTDISED